jgi:hypothetical protein
MGAPTIIHTVFANNVANQQAVSDKVHKGNTDLSQRIWRIPPSWAGDPLDIPLFSVPFTRLTINEDYMLTFQSEDGREADAMAAKLQGDHVSSQERAFRYRHAGHIRCVMHGANRRRGHAMAGSGIHARIVEHVQDVIVSRNAGG